MTSPPALALAGALLVVLVLEGAPKLGAGLLAVLVLGALVFHERKVPA